MLQLGAKLTFSGQRGGARNMVNATNPPEFRGARLSSTAAIGNRMGFNSPAKRDRCHTHIDPSDHDADRDTGADQPGSDGSWPGCFESSSICDSYEVVKSKSSAMRETPGQGI